MVKNKNSFDDDGRGQEGKENVSFVQTVPLKNLIF